MGAKLRKLFGLIWLNKERMVLFVMVGFLGYRVYEVVYPPPPPTTTPLRPPIRNLPEDASEQEGLVPGGPPPRPALDAPEDFSSIYRRNPFHFEPGSGRGDTTDEVDKVDIKLTNIQQVNDGYRAQLQRGAARDWFKEGEQFEGYVLEEINADEQTVIVYVERLEKRLTLPKGG